MKEFDYLFSDTAPELQKTHVLKDRRHIRRDAKRVLIKNTKKDNFQTILKGSFPAPLESYHIISNGTFDLFTLIDYFVEVFKVINEFHGSTWATSPGNVKDLLKYYDEGKIKSISILLGDYHKMKSRAEFGLLANGLLERNQRFAIFNNHVKILLINKDADFITVESSANFTSNPRLEQHVITNDFELYQFHKSWLDELLQSKNKETFIL